MRNEHIDRVGIEFYSKWKEIALGDVIDVKHGYAFNGKHIVETPTNNILVTPGNFHIGGGFKSSKYKYYNSDFPSDYILKPNDIVVTMTDLSQETDTLGYSAKIPKQNGINYLHNQRIGLVQFKSNDVDKNFIYWILRTKEYQGFIVGSASGTSIMHTAPTRIKEYSFLLPPIQEQTAIASILSSLDDKIDLLNRQNKTLEKLAETLFRQWFVEEAEESTTLGEIAKVSTGKGLKRNEFVENGLYPILGANGEIGRTNDYLTDEMLILTGRVGTLGEVKISRGKVWISDNVLIINPNKSKYFYPIYFSLTRIEFENMNVGSTQPLITQTDLKKIEIKFPNEFKLEKFTEDCNLYFDKINKNTTQIHTLTQTRDTLLPKLMNGEVRVEI